MIYLFRSIISLYLIFLVTACSADFIDVEKKQVVILDTDISSDVDDVGAVAVLHGLAEQGKTEILAMMISSGDPWSGPCLQALNTWFGRPDIPIGIAGKEAVAHESKYTRIIAQEYLSVEQFRPLPDAVLLYRQLLAGQPERSVTLITIGYLTNLEGLLKSKPDTYSSLDGLSLVKSKVKKVICMGGKYPQGREWNFYQDAGATQYVVSNWPTPIVFCGFEIGVSVLTGSRLHSAGLGNPVKKSYVLYNNLTDRSSWDQVAVLYGVLDKKHRTGYWELEQGNNVISDDGSNTWKKGKSKYTRFRMLNRADNQTFVDLIYQFMLHEKSER